MTPEQDCFARLARAPEFQLFRDWLQVARREARDLLETLPPDKIQLVQGKAQALRELQNLLDRSMGGSSTKTGGNPL